MSYDWTYKPPCGETPGDGRRPVGLRLSRLARPPFWAVVVLLASASEWPAQEAAPVSDVAYAVAYDRESARQGHFQVDMAFRTDGSGPIVLSLPAWTPGSYELDNFARFVADFSAEVDGEEVRWEKADHDSWRVHPTTAGEVRVSFAVHTDTLDTGMSWMQPDFAFFNGTNLFLFPEDAGYDFPATVTIRTEPDWSVATGLTPGGTPGEYTAASYHELVDMPTFVGEFDVDSARIDGVWYRLATYPRGALDGRARATSWEELRRMLPPMIAVFGDVPFETYTTLMVFDPDFGGGSALEHANSHLGIYDDAFIGNVVLPSIVAHEIFHAWNVKRLRPAELVPYDYDRAQPTTLLWMAEGITDYYADLALVRGGILPPEGFYQFTAGKIGTVANAAPVALEDASLSTWIEPADGTAFLYYPKGSLAGLLLDILIRDASDNQSSLDTVLRALYTDVYQAGRGFTEDEWWEAVSRAASGPTAIDLDQFRAAYVDGRDPYPWDRVLPLAGLALANDTIRAPRIGVSVSYEDEGVRVDAVTPGSAAAAVGVREDDVLIRIGEIEIEDNTFGARYRQRYADAPAGTGVELVVRREGEELNLPLRVTFAESVQFAIVETSDASEKASRIRRGILTGDLDS